MSKTITANSGAIKLTSTHAAYSPLSVNAGITVAGGAYGVYGDNSQAWSILNHGVISGSISNGVYGFVHNYAGARIAGAVDGLVIAGGTASVGNFGSIAGATTGVYLRGGGSILNLGTISAGKFGIAATGTAVNVTNDAGTLTGGTDGVYLLAGGTVGNFGSLALLSGGSKGVLIDGAGTVTNSGTISGTNSASGVGVSLESTGFVTNTGAAAYIGGPAAGIDAAGVATIANQGSITASQTFGFGINLAAGGVVTNSAGARISGLYAIFSIGAATVTNDGALFGSGDALQLIGGGRITNNPFATISGGSGFQGFGPAAFTVVNQGLISAAGSGAGVFFGTGSVANLGTSAVISGGNFGVAITGGVDTITNDGTITGSVQDGVYLNSGTVTNTAIGSDISGAT
jgi:hypothetical protein